MTQPLPGVGMYGLAESGALDGTPKPPVANGPIGRPRRWVGRIFPTLVLIAAAIFFIAPLLTLARYSLQNVPTIRLGWSTLFDNWSFDGVTMAFHDPTFWPTLRLSLKLALLTVVLTITLLLPTAIWVHLRLPRIRSIIEFLTLLPYMIPAIALVAGIVAIKPHARWFLDSDLALVPFYAILALPFTYRIIDAGLRAIDLRTLVDASRSLGAGWGVTIRKVLLPNLRASVISVAFLSAAVVLGEYTIASVLLKETFPTFQRIYVGREPQGGYGLILVGLVGTMLLFAILFFLTRPRTSPRRPFVIDPEQPA